MKNAESLKSYTAMNQLFHFSSAVKRDPDIEEWMHVHSGELGTISKYWFDVMRNCGNDVRELLHDGGSPTDCLCCWISARFMRIVLALLPVEIPLRITPTSFTQHLPTSTPSKLTLMSVSFAVPILPIRTACWKGLAGLCAM